MRTISFSQKAFGDYYTWSLRDKKIFEKINDLIIEITRDPFRGTGKPEPLKGNLQRLLVKADHSGTPVGLRGQ
jgi:toxin YoeB